MLFWTVKVSDMKQRPPGLLRPREEPNVMMMLCTAGHVDHGKTSLVKFLTGCSTDRLKEEQERGLTIELGFAPCQLPDNLCVGIVDVPGHEKFIRNMVAGVSGIQMTILVIAADDGIMPQTEEHFQIMDLLGVRNGIVALTKIDLVDADTVSLRCDEIRAFLAGTFMHDAPICPLSSATFDGVPEFYQVLVETVKGVEIPSRPGLFRMPVEKIFKPRGAGTVLTGIPIQGRISVGDTVEAFPGGTRSKVRGIQSFLRDTKTGEHGRCLALNVPDFGKQTPERGMVLGPPGVLRPVHIFHARLGTVANLEHPVKHAEEVHLHTGTAEQIARVYLLEGKTLEENESSYATIVSREPLIIATHDRFIIRRMSPAITIGGGIVLSTARGERRPRRRESLERIQCIEEFLKDIEPFSPAGIEAHIQWTLVLDYPYGCTVDELAAELLLDSKMVSLHLERLESAGIVERPEPLRVLHCEIREKLYKELSEDIKHRVRENNLLNIPLNDLRRNRDWPPTLWSRLLALWETRGEGRVQGDRLIPAIAHSQLPAEDRELIDKLIALYDEAGFETPRIEDVASLINGNPTKTLKLIDQLSRQGDLIRLNPKVVMSRKKVIEAQNMAIRIINEQGSLNSGDFRSLINSSRKYALAILEFLDAKHITFRKENDRRLMPNYEKRLLS